jgi:hypothetical protein
VDGVSWGKIRYGIPMAAEITSGLLRVTLERDA